MSAPIRSASASPFAAPRPLVQSRRVSLRVGSFGVTYATDKVLWSAEAPKAYATIDPPPVDPAPQIESERPQNQAETSTFPPDLEAARKRVLWNNAQNNAAQNNAAQNQAAQSQAARQQDASTQAGQTAEATSGESATVEAASPADEAASANADAASAAQAQGAGRKASLVQAMRRATSAYLSCAACLTTPGPMLQAIA